MVNTASTSRSACGITQGEEIIELSLPQYNEREKSSKEWSRNEPVHIE